MGSGGSVVPTEDAEQRIFVQWLRIQGLPFFRVPNETYTKSWSQKAKNKALGVVPGVPDLFIAIPYVGLVAVEMKRRKLSVTSEAQKEWIKTLNGLPGVEAHICKGADVAIELIESFLSDKPIQMYTSSKTVGVKSVSSSEYKPELLDDSF